MTADKGARAAFLKGLQDPDYHIRIAACEALGQLGHPEARAALQRATQDEHHAVRAAATWALTALDTPRVLEEELTGLALVLVQQMQHLGPPLAREVTDRRGRVRFPHVPADAVCRVHLLSKPQETGIAAASARPVWHLPAHELPSQEPQALAAKSAQDTPSSLPQTHEIALEDGSLLGTLYRDERGQRGARGALRCAPAAGRLGLCDRRRSADADGSVARVRGLATGPRRHSHRHGCAQHRPRPRAGIRDLLRAHPCAPWTTNEGLRR